VIILGGQFAGPDLQEPADFLAGAATDADHRRECASRLRGPCRKMTKLAPAADLDPDGDWFLAPPRPFVAAKIATTASYTIGCQVLDAARRSPPTAQRLVIIASWAWRVRGDDRCLLAPG